MFMNADGSSGGVGCSCSLSDECVSVVVYVLCVEVWMFDGCGVPV